MTDRGRYSPKHGVPSDYVSKKQLDKATDRIERVLNGRKDRLERLEARLDELYRRYGEALEGSQAVPPPPLTAAVIDQSERTKIRADIIRQKVQQRLIVDRSSSGGTPPS